MKIFASGIGPGDVELISLKALHKAQNCDVLIIPRAHSDTKGIAEMIITHHLPDKKYIPLTFPMTSDIAKRNELILSQLEAIYSDLVMADEIFFPVIGDAMLYSTANYFLEAMIKLFPKAEIEFIPGISAHSLAASCAKKFLAMRDEIFTIIPGTATSSQVRAALSSCHNAAIYKPTALHDIAELIQGFNVMRIDYAGIKELERIIVGREALVNIQDYLSIILLWRD